MVCVRTGRTRAGFSSRSFRCARNPPPVKAISAKQIRAKRLGLGCTPTGFATLLNVPAVTAISCEKGTRKPSGAALRLLAVARHHPQALPAAQRCGTISFADILALPPERTRLAAGGLNVRRADFFSASLIYMIDVKGGSLESISLFPKLYGASHGNGFVIRRCETA